MSRNFGFGSRCMTSAARIALDQAVQRGEISFSAKATYIDRFSVFVTHLKSIGIGRLERVTADVVINYGRQLADQVDDEEISPAYAQNLVSSINTVMSHVTNCNWRGISPTRECAIAKRCQVRTTPPSGLDRERLSITLHEIREQFPHGAIIAEIARSLGLRTKEAALLDAAAALKEAMVKGVVSITTGTKGGRPRKVPVFHEHQIISLKKAVEVQGNHHSLVPTSMSWAEFRANELRATREWLQQYGISRLHDLRAAYACERYQEITGHPAPVFGSRIEKEIDAEARLQISRELGHNRIDVTNSYLGGRRK